MRRSQEPGFTLSQGVTLVRLVPRLDACASRISGPWLRSDLLLPLGLDQFQHPEFPLRDIRQRDRQPDILGAQDAETPSHESTVWRIHRLFKQVLRAPRPICRRRWPSSPLRRRGNRPIPSAQSSCTSGSGRRGRGTLRQARTAFPGAAPTGSGSERPGLPASRRARLFRVFIRLDGQLRDDLGHRSRLVDDRHRAGVAVVRDVQLIVECAARLQKRPRLNRPPRRHDAG